MTRLVPTLFGLLGVASLAAGAAAPQMPSRDELAEAEILGGVPLDALRYDDALRARSFYAQGDLFEQFLRLIFPISAREKRTPFLSIPYWGPKKPQYRRFDWHKFESAHFDFFTYPDGEAQLPNVVSYIEGDYDRNNRIFGVENRFIRKVPILFYQSRRDFEQSTVIEGPIPESLGGLTEIFAWRRVTFPFEGSQERLEHVARHEGTHVYQIAKGARRLPLWFVEGTAETNSIRWDAQAEMVIRDAYVNGFFHHLDELWQIEGTWLMYKQGNFITNLIWDEYGERGYRRIYERADSLPFDQNIKESLGITLGELDGKVFAALAARYGHLLAQKDLLAESEKLEERKTLLDSHGPFYLSGGAKGPRNALYLNRVSPDGRIVREAVVSDRRYRNESLNYFRKGASLDDQAVLYAIKRSERDVIRRVPYRYDQEEREFVLEAEEEFSWPDLSGIDHPVAAGENRIAFVATVNGFTNLYLFDRATKKVEALTTGTSHYADLDYSPARNELVFSREDKPGVLRAHYDRNLYTLHLGTHALTQLTDTPAASELEPAFSPDGGKLLFVSDAGETYDLFSYDFATRETLRLTRMQVGALHPHWSEGGMILFSGFEKTTPAIYRARMPGARVALANDFPAGRGQKVVLRESSFVVERPAEPTATPTPEATDGLHFEDGKPIVVSRGDTFSVQGVAREADEWVLSTERGHPGEKRVEEDDRMHYFILRGHELISLESEMVDRKGLRPSREAEIRRLLDGRPIINAWETLDQREALIIINNRLAAQEERFKGHSETGVAIYNAETGSVQEIKSGPLGEFSDLVHWVAFLKEDKIFLAMGDSAAGPYDLYWYDRRKEKYVELDQGVQHFRISADRARVAWRKGDSFWIASASRGEIARVRGVDSSLGSEFAFHFHDDGRLLIFVTQGERWMFCTVPPQELKVGTCTPLNSPKGERALGAAVDPATGRVAVRSGKTEGGIRYERLFLFRPDNGELVELSGGEARFPSYAFRKGYFFYTQDPFGPDRSSEWVYHGSQIAPLDRPEKGEALDDGSIVLQTEGELSHFAPAKGTTQRIWGETSGYAVAPGRVIFSGLVGEHYRLHTFDLATAEVETITTSEEDAVDPVVAEGMLTWASKGKENWRILRAPLDRPKEVKVLELPGYDTFHPRRSEAGVVADAYPKEKPKPAPGTEREAEAEPMKLLGKPPSYGVRLQQLTAGAAYDGSNVRYFIYGFADNLFSDRGLFVSSAFLEDAKYATVGYTNLASGLTYSFFYNARDEIDNYGIQLERRFTLDRYREATIYGNFELQDYGHSTPDTAHLFDGNENETFYLLKVGNIFAHDVTVWDRHGPVSGSRFFLRTEAGFDTTRANLANIDVNVDVRLYNQFLPRFGLAHRVVAGTSQGDLPNIFLLGGNMSFRGFGFDDLEGQNYWTVSEDLRVPVFDFIGAKFFDPVDAFLGFLTRYFDVRAGIYADVGAAWFNEDEMDVQHSVGYFVNVPTIFGVVFRFNQGFLGGKAIGIWLGANW